MNERKGFTLIELIIVVVIIGILALVAIPKYYANVNKAMKSQVYTHLHAINQAQITYYAAYGAWPASSTWPITIVVDGDTIYNLSQPVTSGWSYTYSSSGYASRGSAYSRAYYAQGNCSIYLYVSGAGSVEDPGCSF